jgi:hypothetical protein
MAEEVSFRQLFCREIGCGMMFFICRTCYRGQAYCSDGCRLRSRREQRRNANRRYQQDPEVRQDHRQHMRELRRQQRESRVIDQSSALASDSGTLSPPLVKQSENGSRVEEVRDQAREPWRNRAIQIVCVICGRVGRWIAARMRRE